MVKELGKLRFFKKRVEKLKSNSDSTSISKALGNELLEAFDLLDDINTWFEGRDDAVPPSEQIKQVEKWGPRVKNLHKRMQGDYR